MTLKDLKILILCSLYVKPADLNELIERDFLKNTSRTGVDRLLMSMEQDRWIYLRGETMYAYKSAVKEQAPEFIE